MKLTKQNAERLEKFARHCAEELGLKGKINITFSKHQTGLPTAGYFDPYTSDIFVAVHNRAIADVMRTLAHELTHCRQKQQGTEFPHEDQGLQPLENEANVKSGILVRFYGRKHPEIYADLSPTYLQEFLFPNANNRKIIGS